MLECIICYCGFIRLKDIVCCDICYNIACMSDLEWDDG